MSAVAIYRRYKSPAQLADTATRLRRAALQVESLAHLAVLLKALPERHRVPMLRGLRPYLRFVVPDDWCPPGGSV